MTIKEDMNQDEVLMSSCTLFDILSDEYSKREFETNIENESNDSNDSVENVISCTEESSTKKANKEKSEEADKTREEEKKSKDILENTSLKEFLVCLKIKGRTSLRNC